MAHVILPKNFDVSDISFDAVKKNSMGGKVVYLKHGGNKNITLQTPLMSAPFGISGYTDDKTGITKHSLDISFKGAADDPKIQTFLDKMNEFDKCLIETAAKNSKDWLGKSMKKDVVEALYRPLIKPSKDPEKYAPTIKFKVPSKDGKMLVDAFDHKKQPFDLNNFVPGTRVQAIIECSSVWFVNKQFGVSWKLVQLRMSKPEKLTGFSFIPDGDEDPESDSENENEEPKENDSAKDSDSDQPEDNDD